MGLKTRLECFSGKFFTWFSGRSLGLFQGHPRTRYSARECKGGASVAALLLGGGSAFGLIAWGSGKPSPFTKPQPASPVPSPSLSQPPSQPSPFTEPQPAIQPNPFTKPQPNSQPSFFTGPQSTIQPCLFSKPQPASKPASQPSLKPREGFELNSPRREKTAMEYPSRTNRKRSNKPPQEQTENGVTNPSKTKQKTE